MSYTISGKTGEWEITMGLEVHCQVKTNSKLFSRSSTEFGAHQNTHVSFYDAAMPGQLPVINQHAVEQVIKTGLGINATINLRSVFDRKNYFYADLPSGYQITQMFHPIVENGYLEVNVDENDKKKIRINRIHIEQDAGKLIHDMDPKNSLVDLNRAGVTLMEIVSEPDLSSPNEAVEYLKKLRALVRALDTSNGDMEKGSMRCDVNVSVKKVGSKELGTRCEIKNVNSLKNVSDAIIYEAKRQIDLIENGEEVSQETRLYDANKGETRTMRSKEDAIDYRYFPDPDLAPLIISQELVDKIKSELPELPEQKKERYMKEYGLDDYNSSVLTLSKEISDYFEHVVQKHNVKLTVTWITSELFGRLNKLSLDITESPVSAEQMSGLLSLIEDETISGKIAKDVLDEMMETKKDAATIVEEKGLKQVIDLGEVAKVVEQVIKDNPTQVEQYKGGNERLLGFFVGQVMKVSGGKLNPKAVNDILKEKLK